MSALWQSIRAGGPGWLQGAMTLGGGSAITSLTLGAAFGYEFLWVQPVAMLIGCVMLFALAHQTLSTGEAPFEAMRRHVSPTLAWLWGIAALASSVIWGFSHYPLAAGMLEEAVAVSAGLTVSGAARELYLFVLALLVWALCALTVWRYTNGGVGVRAFETAIKLLSALVIAAFAWVVLRAGERIDWGHVLAGFVPSSLPTTGFGVTTLMAALGTAVGINMTFVYGYTLLDRGWGRDERPLARIDIVLGLVLPYLLVTTLISVAAAGALHGDGDLASRISPARAGEMFVAAGLGEVAGRLIFPLGVLGMAVGSLVMHMLTCGAAAKAMLALNDDSLGYRLACLLPTPAVLGVFLWSSMGPYVILPTSAICGFLLPIAYVGWLLLNNRGAFLGNDMPTGARRIAYNAAMLACIALVAASVCYSTGVGLGWLP
ncbi:MAG: divalent metal cation transporter [Pseudomonadota bacterium]